MHKLIFTTLIFIGSIANAGSCFILSEDTLGTINSNLLDTVKQDNQKAQEAIAKKQAYVIPTGSKICNTGKSNFNGYTRQITFEEKTLWIDDRVQAEKIQ